MILQEMAAPVATAQRGNKYLTFSLGSHEYGLKNARVRQIVAGADVSAVARAPRCVKGILELRGQIYSVVDLRLRLGLPEKPATPRTRIIVLDVLQDGWHLNVGIIVDAVGDVIDVDPERIEPFDPTTSGTEAALVLGTMRTGWCVRELLDVDRALNFANANA